MSPYALTDCVGAGFCASLVAYPIRSVAIRTDGFLTVLRQRNSL